jgi:hypothetical protein
MRANCEDQGGVVYRQGYYGNYESCVVNGAVVEEWHVG